MFCDSDAAWKRYGEDEPYFGVYSTDDFLSRNLDEEALDEFFKYGEVHVEHVLDTVRERLDGDFEPKRALDFGCGVGRMTIPLARVCPSVVGADVSEHMLAEARKNCDARGISNVDLVESDDELSRVGGGFDFVHSFVVFQHIPVKRGEDLLRRIIARLDDGGVGVLHFTYHREAPAVRKVVNRMRMTLPLVNNLVNVVQRNEFSRPFMQMNGYSLNNLFRILQTSGCGNPYVRFTDHGGYLGVILFFKKREADASWPVDHTR